MPGNDSLALIMEEGVAIDLGQGGGTARAARVAGVCEGCPGRLVGWRVSVAVLPAQALKPTITHTPAGDPVDLTGAGLIPADGVVFIAAHLSRAETFDGMARSFGRRRTRSGPPGSGIRHLRRGLSQPAALFGRVRHALPRQATRTQSPHHALGTGAPCRSRTTRRPRSGTRIRCSSHDVRRAVARSLHRSQRAHARLDLYGASAHRECRSRRSCALFFAAVMAQSVELRPFQCQGGRRMRPGSSGRPCCRS